MESANRRRERRKQKKWEQVEIWKKKIATWNLQLGQKLQLGIQENYDSYEENIFYVLLKAMELLELLKANSSENFQKQAKLERENLALASRNGPRELKIRKLEDKVKELKQELREKDGEVENFKAQIWPQGFDNYA